jgi:hypothetical protein
LEKETSTVLLTQIRPYATVVLMRDINQKSSNSDKRIAIAFRRSVQLSYLLSLCAISAGGVSIFSVAAILGTKPAQANLKEQAANLPNQAVEEQPGNQSSSCSSEATCLKEYDQQLVNKELSGDTEGDLKATSDLTNQQQPEQPNLKTSETSQVLTTKAEAPYAEIGHASALEDSSNNDDAKAKLSQGQPEQTVLAPTQPSIAKLPVFTASSQSQTPEFKFAPDTVVPVLNSVEGNVPGQSVVAAQPTTVVPAFVPPTPNSVEGNLPKQVAFSNEPSPVVPAQTPAPTAVTPTVHKGSGGAALLGDNIQAQTSTEPAQQQRSPAERASQSNEALAPTLIFQGAYVYQGDSSARARLTGVYPFSPNALVGGTVDLGTGPDFSDPQAGSLRVSELYFTGNLPNYPKLRMSAGLLDLTSFFDRNSFAKDVTTHFFNPVFQTNPALAATGIASRPAVVLNWNITDNVEAKVAGFSSAQSIGDFALDGFASELGFRYGNGIIRATYATDRDVDKNGFGEIYGIPRSPGEFGPRSSDRETAYGINAEYFIPEIKMGLFGRYGHYENTSIDRGGDTYSLGVNFLDLFMRDDRLGFGYGRNLSNDDLRRQDGGKVPDVWELFYDVRLSPILRAAVTLQERKQFSETVFGFRVKTEFDLLGRLFR